MIGKCVNWWLDKLERFGKASIAGIAQAQPPVWPECQIVDGCHEESTCIVGRPGARLYGCFKHGREYLGVGRPLGPTKGCDLGAGSFSRESA